MIPQIRLKNGSQKIFNVYFFLFVVPKEYKFKLLFLFAQSILIVLLFILFAQLYKFTKTINWLFETNRTFQKDYIENCIQALFLICFICILWLGEEYTKFTLINIYMQICLLKYMSDIYINKYTQTKVKYNDMSRSIN